MDLNLSGRHALVCGASEGIGRATAEELAGLGATVTVLSRREGVLREVVAGLAGGADRGPLHAAGADAFEEAFRRNVIANQLLQQGVLPGMREARWGRIINVVSTSVREPIPGLGVSNTIRGAVASWAKTLARELAAEGITVNNVLPGFTETGRIRQLISDRAAREGCGEDDVRRDMEATVPARRFAEPHETGGVIAFLCSPAAAYVNGVSLAVDGGRMASI